MNKTFTLKALTIIVLAHFGLVSLLNAQTCTPLGNQTSYGTNNTWIGYVYSNQDLTGYVGYVNEGTSTNPNFDEGFGGDNVTYTTNGCSTTTETFSVRYKLTKALSGTYDITVGGDDGYRLSLDGGATWTINKWFDQSYASTTTTVTLNGTYNMVLEFYENGGQNRITFNITAACVATPVTETYGTGNVWKGYIFQGTSFNTYKGSISRGNTISSNFDESWGGNNVSFATGSCSITTEQFSARFRVRKNFINGTYNITIGGDDGYRLSFDGGATWAVNKWNDQSYSTTTWTGTLNGWYNIVLEYYENGGGNRLSIDFGPNGNAGFLPVSLSNFTGKQEDAYTQLNWTTVSEQNTDHFDVQRSVDGQSFTTKAQVYSLARNGNSSTQLNYNYIDRDGVNGTFYYRLRIVDKDGSATFSNIIRLGGQSTNQPALRIYPTLASQRQVWIAPGTTMKNVTIDVYSMSGARMQREHYAQILGGQGMAISLNGSMPRGMYLVTVTDDTQAMKTEKIIIP